MMRKFVLLAMGLVLAANANADVQCSAECTAVLRQTLADKLKLTAQVDQLNADVARLMAENTRLATQCSGSSTLAPVSLGGRRIWTISARESLLKSRAVKDQLQMQDKK